MQRSTNRKCAPAASETDSTVGRADLAARKMSELGQEFATCRDAFIALGDESRQLIFMQLLQNYGGMRVGELTDTVGLSRPTVSHHLKILKDAGLVSMYSVGTTCQLQPGQMAPDRALSQTGRTLRGRIPRTLQPGPNSTLPNRMKLRVTSPLTRPIRFFLTGHP